MPISAHLSFVTCTSCNGYINSSTRLFQVKKRTPSYNIPDLKLAQQSPCYQYCISRISRSTMRSAKAQKGGEREGGKGEKRACSERKRSDSFLCRKYRSTHPTALRQPLSAIAYTPPPPRWFDYFRPQGKLVQGKHTNTR